MEELFSLDGVAVPGGFTADGAQLIFSKPDASLWRLDIGARRSAQVGSAGGRLIGVSPDGRHVVIFGADQLPSLRPLDEKPSPGEVKDVPVDTTAVSYTHLIRWRPHRESRRVRIAAASM